MCSLNEERSRTFWHNRSSGYQLFKKWMLASAVAFIILGVITSIALFSKKPPNAPQLPSSEQQTGGHDNFVDLVDDNDESPQQSNDLSQEDGGRVPTSPPSSEHKNAWVYDNERETSSPTENEEMDWERDTNQEPSQHPSQAEINHSSITPSASPTENAPLLSYDAVIIGAGWAGLKAAETLLSSKISSVLILEANGEVGGRARSDNDFTPGVPTELGCEWLYTAWNDMAPVLTDKHGLDVAPSYDIGDSYFATYVQSVDDNGCTIAERMSDTDRNEKIKSLWKGNQGFRKFAQESSKMLQKNGSDESYADALASFESQNGIGEEDRQILNQYEDSFLETEYSGNSKSLSVKEISYYMYYSTAMKYTAVPGGGFGNAAASFAKPFMEKIKLNAEVTEINYTEKNNVIISYSENGMPKKVTARSTLVTASLGVLKADTINFIPKLPKTKQDAIDNAGFGSLNKCIMYWEDPGDIVWPTDKLWLELVTPEDETSGKWTSFFNPMDFKGIPMLIGWIAGDDSVEMEDQSDEEVLNDVMKNLSTMFPSIRRPTKTIVTRWGKEPHVRGAYSFEKVGRNFQDDASNLRQSVNSLWFAGEATDSDGWHASTIGSWTTGEEAANDMASSLVKKGAN